MSKDPEMDWNQRGLQCKMTAKFDLQHLHPGLFADYPSQLASSLRINPARQIHTTQQTPPPAPLTGHGRSMGQNRTDNLHPKEESYDNGRPKSASMHALLENILFTKEKENELERMLEWMMTIRLGQQSRTAAARRPQLLPTKQRAARLALAGAALAFGGERQTSAAIGRLWIDLHVE
ncbi:hypothetical protein T12_6759 [Trichinella patagoniensis]|uniref:Uncharacterized protein n=1 Tax=Trichinella patagoniensis TaxID=990121 RepID=A0A0V1A1E6_9BILA|nr:hypothetical protein T12_6759 [Trichinella patagoniensis]